MNKLRDLYEVTVIAKLISAFILVCISDDLCTVEKWNDLEDKEIIFLLN